MTENAYGFSSGDDFEGTVGKIRKALEDPSFVEQVNALLIVDCTLDGQRSYTKEHMEMVKNYEIEAIKQNRYLEPEDRRNFLLNLIGEHTNNFTEVGSCRISGEKAFNKVDEWFYELGELDIDLEKLNEIAEVEISTALWLGARKAYESYQVDFTINGQGTIEETYFIDMQFRPIPKNIQEK